MSMPPAAITGATITGLTSPSRVPPPPPPPPRREDLQQAIAAAQVELRQARLEIERQREQIKGRDTHIAELREKLQGRDLELAELRARTISAPTATTVAASDDLKRIKGVGPGFERALREAGVTSFATIAAWTPDDVARFAELLGTHKSRIERAQWIEQARVLAGG
jgi:predicted flap endonuclease-1-like 5' DNA nuclease